MYMRKKCLTVVLLGTLFFGACQSQKPPHSQITDPNAVFAQGGAHVRARQRQVQGAAGAGGEVEAEGRSVQDPMTLDLACLALVVLASVGGAARVP